MNIRLNSLFKPDIFLVNLSSKTKAVSAVIIVVSIAAYLIFKFSRSRQNQIKDLCQNIYLFRGNSFYQGVSIESLITLREAISKYVKNALFRHIDGEDALISKWDCNGLLILPGGRTSDWEKMVSSTKQKEILSWINHGGRIYAECAGSYFCSFKSDYRFSQDHRIIKIRDLVLYHGTCLGPLYSHEVAIGKVRWERTKKEGYVIVIGAGEFVPVLEGTQEVLATFIDTPENREVIAVVKCPVGQGIAILSTPHWGLKSSHLVALQTLEPHRFQEIEMMKQKLDSSHSFREECLREMFEECLKKRKFTSKTFEWGDKPAIGC